MAALREEFLDALADDFNTPGALGALFKWIREANRRDEEVGGADLREMLDVLGLANLLEPDEQGPGAEVRALADERATAREERDFDRADRLRDELAERGWEVRDGPEGPQLVPLR
jgi:cysteinyl-tRNA synthetase